MSVSDAAILVVGYGSIGRRHFRNLKSLGYQDVRLLRSGRTPAEGFESPAGTTVYNDLEAALEDHPAAVIVANPTALHAPTVRASVNSGAAVLLEKPVCASFEEALALKDDIDTADGLCSMAYCFRYHPLYREAKSVVDEGMLGRVFHVHAWQASYLPSWHPWEDYRTSYAAREDLGGGVVRTLDHDLDMLRWMFGHPEEVLASAGPLSGITVEVEDTADMIFRFPSRMQAHVHVSFGRRDYSRGMWIVGEEASARLDWKAGKLTVENGTDVLHEYRLGDEFDLNEIYLDMLRDALEGFRRHEAAVPLSDGVAALEMAEGALRSSDQACAVSLHGLKYQNESI